MRGVFVLIFLLVACSLSPVSASSNIMDVGDDTSVLGLLNGSGVVIAVADTGIDLDHSCFRNSSNEIGQPGLEHRKIIHLNDSIDDWDTQGHQQFKHGTHIAGILACDQLEGDADMRSLSHGSRLVVQDIVNSTGWNPPESVDVLLAESASYGAVINSWSWGDNTIDYTNRSQIIDEYTVENPWSLVFVAPGNNGGMVLEPSNSYNVVSVAATNSDEEGGMWPSSSHGPDVNGRRGVLISAPGINIVSAKADGSRDGMNSESYAMTGTSMATPMAASFTALLQEMIQNEYGYTPSAPLLRALLASSAEGITGGGPDNFQGYGRPDLSSFETDFFVHDSYAVDDWVSIIQSRGGLEDMKANPWDGAGAAGPFLSENESWSRVFSRIPGEDMEIVMSYNARSDDYEIDDLRLILKTSDGRFAVDDNFNSSGFSKIYYDSALPPIEHNSSNETTVMVRIPHDRLIGVEWVEVEVVAKNIHLGQNQDMLGLEGTKVGFGLVASGVTNLSENTAPVITLIDGPVGGENYSENMSISIEIDDYENDSFDVAFVLTNQNYSVVLDNCSRPLGVESNVLCYVDVLEDLPAGMINRYDWSFEVVVNDDNSSLWTAPMATTFSTENFTIWWEPVLLQNTAPIITLIDGPVGGENYSENISISVGIEDYENDSFVVGFRLVNLNYTVDLGDCTRLIDVEGEINCLVDISKDLVPRPINRDDWSVEVVVVDNNMSSWTSPMISTYTSENITLWWESPLLDGADVSPTDGESGLSEQNRALIWGVMGVVIGTIVAAGVMFRRFEQGVLDVAPPPFREEE